MNHIASVTSPLVGGLIWMKFDYRLVFLGGAVFALISLIVTQWIKAQPVVMDAELEMATD